MAIILVIGFSFGGLGFVETISPKLPAGAKVIVLDPSSHSVYHVGLARGIASPKYAEELFEPNVDYFAKFKGADVTFRQESVDAVEPEKRQVTLKSGEVLQYDYLVVASGSSTGRPWKSDLKVSNPHLDMQNYLSTARESIRACSTVCVGGGGALGVEIASEIREHFPDKRIVLVNSRKRLLERGEWPDWYSTKAEAEFKKHSIEVLHSRRVVEPVETSIITTTVTLNNGDEIKDAVYFSATGYKPNSDFLPREMLTADGHVKVLSTLQTEAYPDTIFAVGDLTTFNRRYAGPAYMQGAQSSQSILDLLQNAKPSGHYDEEWQFHGMIPLGTWHYLATFRNGQRLPSFIARRLFGDLGVARWRKIFSSSLDKPSEGRLGLLMRLLRWFF